MPVTTLKDMKEENDDEKRQAYYAGGQGQNGGGSGQEILDPREFMERARNEMGAQSVDEWQSQQPSGTQSFTGSGNTLSDQSIQGAPAPQKPMEHTITFWQNGFSVDDGPLRTRDDPESEAFLAAVNRGQMPAEFIGPNGEAEGDVHIIDKSGEPYKPPSVTLKPFSGEGRSMRDPSAASSSAEATEAAELTLDESAPTTTLQIRLSDGSRKVVKANKAHTVLQLKQHVASLTPGVAAFSLRAGFPPKKLEEMNKTLEEAGLLGEAITQSVD